MVSLLKNILEKLNIQTSKKEITIGKTPVNLHVFAIGKANIQFITHNAETSSAEKKLYEKDATFIKENLLETAIPQTKIFYDRKNTLKRFKSVLSSKDLAALNAAYTAVFLEDAKHNKAAKEQYDNIRQIFEDRGRAIYNFCRSGLFEKPSGGIYKKITELGDYNDLQNRDEFQIYFEGLIKKHPTNIYVARDWDTQRIIKEITNRLLSMEKKNKVNIIKIYGRGNRIISNIKKVYKQNDIKEAFNIKYDEYTFGVNKAITVYLSIKTQTS